MGATYVNKYSDWVPDENLKKIFISILTGIEWSGYIGNECVSRGTTTQLDLLIATLLVTNEMGKIGMPIDFDACYNFVHETVSFASWGYKENRETIVHNLLSNDFLGNMIWSLGTGLGLSDKYFESCYKFADPLPCIDVQKLGFDFDAWVDCCFSSPELAGDRVNAIVGLGELLKLHDIDFLDNDADTLDRWLSAAQRAHSVCKTKGTIHWLKAITYNFFYTWLHVERRAIERPDIAFELRTRFAALMPCAHLMDDDSMSKYIRAQFMSKADWGSDDDTEAAPEASEPISQPRKLGDADVQLNLVSQIKKLGYSIDKPDEQRRKILLKSIKYSGDYSAPIRTLEFLINTRGKSTKDYSRAIEVWKGDINYLKDIFDE